MVGAIRPRLAIHWEIVVMQILHELWAAHPVLEVGDYLPHTVDGQDAEWTQWNSHASCCTQLLLYRHGNLQLGNASCHCAIANRVLAHRELHLPMVRRIHLEVRCTLWQPVPDADILLLIMAWMPVMNDNLYFIPPFMFVNGSFYAAFAVADLL